MKSIIILFLLCSFTSVYGQEESDIVAEDTSIVLQQTTRTVFVSKEFERSYKREYERIKKIYPMALKAAELIEDYDAELAGIEKKRKQKKYGKEAHKNLKEEFTYAIKELYTSEGVLLMKLINRETGRTVSEIIDKYRGNLTSNLYESMGKLWDQDLSIVYDPKGVDWLTEMIIQDIEMEELAFDSTVERVDKEHYKNDRKEYKESSRNYRKAKRKAKRAKVAE